MRRGVLSFKHFLAPEVSRSSSLSLSAHTHNVTTHTYIRLFPLNLPPPSSSLSDEAFSRRVQKERVAARSVKLQCCKRTRSCTNIMSVVCLPLILVSALSSVGTGVGISQDVLYEGKTYGITAS